MALRVEDSGQREGEEKNSKPSGVSFTSNFGQNSIQTDAKFETETKTLRAARNPM